MAINGKDGHAMAAASMNGATRAGSAAGNGGVFRSDLVTGRTAAARTETPARLEPPGAPVSRALLEELHRTVTERYIGELAKASAGPRQLLFKLLEIRELSQDPYWKGRVDLKKVEVDIAKLLLKPEVHELLAEIRDGVLAERGLGTARDFARRIGNYLASRVFLDWVAALPKDQQGLQVSGWLGFIFAYDPATGRQAAEKVLASEIKAGLSGVTLPGRREAKEPLSLDDPKPLHFKLPEE